MRNWLCAALLCHTPLAAFACDSGGPSIFFGDLHVHTALSQDAFGMGATAGPDDAYRYATGHAISPNGRDTLSPDQALDFMAVTDHAEQLGEAGICGNPAHPNYETPVCRIERRAPRLGLLLARVLSAVTGSEPGHCANGACLQARLSAWQQTVEAAEKHNRPCEFTSFVGWEWSGGRGINDSTHRNVIFDRNPRLQEPVSSITHPRAADLWRELDKLCNDDKCRALTLPHNSNLSGGAMFPKADGPEALSDSDRVLSARFERVAEIFQHKGASECFYGPTNIDETCNFELLPYSGFINDLIPFIGDPPSNHNGFLREALKAGLEYRAQGDINPFAMGFIGSTDTHIASAGQTDEETWFSHHNKFIKDTLIPRLGDRNPGGLAAVHAANNTREALFDGLYRRETYATSGHRIQLHAYAGELAPDLCRQSDGLTQARQQGVPMGSDLQINSSSPAIYIHAAKAPAIEGNDYPGLQALQVIKGWRDQNGQLQESVHTVRSVPAQPLNTCSSAASLPAQLCAVWQDPDFNPLAHAFYYVRVLEQASCRWNAWICEREAVSCANPQNGDALNNLCCGDLPLQQQERAWSSPFWYTPDTDMDAL